MIFHNQPIPVINQLVMDIIMAEENKPTRVMFRDWITLSIGASRRPRIKLPNMDWTGGGAQIKKWRGVLVGCT